MGSFDVPLDDERTQLDAFVEEYRSALETTLDGLTEEQARRHLVPSATTLLGLLKHVTWMQRVWFEVCVGGTSLRDLGLAGNPEESFRLTDGDTIASVTAAHREACATARAAVAGLPLDAVVTGHRAGPRTLRWVYLQVLRELAQHCGHADILREQLLAGPEQAGQQRAGAGRGYPQFRQVVLDSTDARKLAEFYRELLGWQYRPGDEPPGPGEPDPAGGDWLVLRDAAGAVRLAFQQVQELRETTWPDGEVPQQLHLDLTVTTADDLSAAHERALGIGARMVYDRTDDPEEPLRVYADPAGHTFCIFQGPPPA